MTTKARIERDYHGKKSVVAYETETLDHVGRLACVLVEKWGMVVAIPDGEDSAGRQRMRLPTPAELSSRALDIAETLMAVLRARGHVVALPDLNEINAENDRVEEAKEASRRA